MVISPKKCGSRSSQLRSRQAQVLSSGGSGRHGMSGWAAWSEGRQRCTYVYAGRRAPKRCAAGVDAGERPHIEFAASCMQVLRSGSVLVLDGGPESCCLLPPQAARRAMLASILARPATHRSACARMQAAPDDLNQAFASYAGEARRGGVLWEGPEPDAAFAPDEVCVCGERALERRVREHARRHREPLPDMRAR